MGASENVASERPSERDSELPLRRTVSKRGRGRPRDGGRESDTPGIYVFWAECFICAYLREMIKELRCSTVMLILASNFDA